MAAKVERFGPYEIVARLGAGGMGEVFRARDPRLGRDVAVKVLPVEMRADPDRLKRFEQEARTLASLNHPNVVAVLDVGVENGSSYFVTELLEGQSLRQRLDEGPMPVRRALECAVQIARGLDAAHGRGIIHRDLKPENLFVLKDGVVKLLDFGIARFSAELAGTRSLTGTGAVIGSSGYMSPEQVRGLPADTRSDVFAFGAVLYEMLAGRPAFGGDTHVDRGYAVLNHEPPPLGEVAPGVPPPVSAIVARCLEKAPEARFQSARDLAFALEALTGSRSHPTLPLAPVPAAPPSRRRVLQGALLAGVPLALGVAGWAGGAVWERRRAAAAAAPARGAPRFTRLTFLPGRLGKAAFAPDGRTILVTAALESAEARVYSLIPGIPDLRPITDERVGLAAVSPSSELALLIRAPDQPEKPPTLATMPLSGRAPREVLESVTYADYGADGLAAMRTERGTYTIEYPLGTVRVTERGGAARLRVSPGGDAIAWLHHPIPADDRGNVELLELASGARRTLARDWYTLTGLEWSPDGREVWITGAKVVADRGEIWALNRSGTLRHLASAPNHVFIEDVGPDGRVLVAAGSIRSRMVFRAAGSSEDVHLAWFDASAPKGLSEDESLVLFDEGGEASGTDYVAYVRRVDASPAVALGPGMARDLSPDGKWALVSPGPEYTQLRLLPTGAGSPRALPDGDFERLFAASFFPDGQRILIHARRRGEPERLFVQGLPQGMPEALSSRAARAPGVISPDGKRVAFVAEEGRLLIVRVDDGATAAERALPRDAGPAQWAHDGRLYLVGRSETPRVPLISRFDPETGTDEPYEMMVRGAATPLAREPHSGLISRKGSVLYAFQVREQYLYLLEDVG